MSHKKKKKKINHHSGQVGKLNIYYHEEKLDDWYLLTVLLFVLCLSVSQLTDMNEQEEVLLEQFLMLPQLKQIITDKEDLVKSIEELASMFPFALIHKYWEKYDLCWEISQRFILQEKISFWSTAWKPKGKPF